MPRPPRILQPHERQVFLAAHCGDVVGLRKICAQHSAAVVNVSDEAGYRPLTIAILQGRLATVQAMVTEFGANVHERLDGFGGGAQTPAQMACVEGHLDVVAFLVQQAGVDPYDCHGTTSVTRDSSENEDQDSGEDEDDDNNPTPQRSLLHVAALHNHLDIVQWLVGDYGMAVDTPDSTGQTALHLASFWHCTAIVDWLLQHGDADPHVVDHDGQTALHLSVARQRHQAAPRPWMTPPQLLPLIHTEDKRGRTPLHQACETRNAMAVLALLQAGANPLVKDAEGRTPLYHLATGGNVQLLQDVLQGILLVSEPQEPQQVQENLHHRISRDALLMELQLPDSSGWSPLHHAIQCGETATVEFLLNLGVQVTPVPANNQTALHLVGSGFVVNWDEYTKSSSSTTTASAATTWPEQYQLATNWLLRYGKWFVQYEPVKNGWPPLKIPPVPRLPKVQDWWDIRPTHDDGRMSQVLLQHANLSVLSKDSNGNLPFFLAAAAGHVSQVFVQLRAAAHEGLFQPQWQQQQQDVSGNVAAGESSTTTTTLSPKRTLTGAIVTPPRQRSRLVYSVSTRSPQF